MIPGRVVNALCAEVGVDPKDVYEITVSPHVVTFRCYSKQDDGKPYLNASHSGAVTRWETHVIDWSEK
jgi:hypothetical protein